ncbi:NAD-dependent succinate-semialdehyde dehydrogenase [Aquipuribacter nitratireducens]|uniref:NAD-dependent succinate-semialdehyde dehydrogenase n=1 Tax=Aquipuribacter nitratireducens TaxID=650104 RepID=A0ABW0GKE0_9MICO
MSTDATPAAVTPERERDVVAAVPTGLLVAGAWRDASGGGTLAVDDPATGRTLTEVADATADDARAALDAAVAAQADWAATAPRERGELLRRAFELTTERAEDLALLMTLEMGKPLAESRGEVAYGAEFLRWFSEEAVRAYGRWSTAPNGASRLLTMKQPVGPCFAITPWNFPLAMATRKIGPALAAGCTMILKPAAQTPLTALAFAQVLLDAGLPDGVVQVLTTRSAGDLTAPLLADARLRKLTFTGSTPVGKRLVAQAADNLQRVSMELGGNAPFLVFRDADVEAAVEGAVLAKMRNIGEACTAANRFLVHADVAEDFSRGLAERLAAMPVGRGTEPDSKVGPLITREARADVHALVAEAVEGGARVLTGGEPLDGPGAFYPPTVLTEVPRQARIRTEEIFGPVAPVGTFTDDDDAVATANATEYGLVAYVYTRDVSRAVRVAEGLQFGMVGLNQGVVSNPAAPFGGVKASGFGREGGAEGIEEYLDTKYVGLAL